MADENGVDIQAMITKAMNVEPVFSKSDIRAIAMANISNGMAVDVQKGRKTFMSSIAKDVMAAQGMAAGGIDLNTLLMINMFNGGAKKEEPKQLSTESIAEAIGTAIKPLLSRLDVIEAEFGEQPERKEVG